MQARLHEQVKTRQTLVSMTVCMICAILSKPEELNLKAPVAMLTSRSIFHLVERYRLTTLLRLQWANLVCCHTLRCSSERACIMVCQNICIHSMSVPVGKPGMLLDCYSTT